MPLEFLAWNSLPLDFLKKPVTMTLININNVITRLK